MSGQTPFDDLDPGDFIVVHTQWEPPMLYCRFDSWWKWKNKYWMIVCHDADLKAIRTCDVCYVQRIQHHGTIS